MIRFVHAVALGLALQCVTGAALAAQLEQLGQPEAPVTTMATYGMDVATRAGLRTVVPAGWHLFIHQDALLPETMAWKMGASWPQVLAEFADTSKLAVLIDWKARTVFVRTAEVAYEESARRQETSQAATTPLPRFDDAVRADAQVAGRIKELEDKQGATASKSEAPSAVPKPEPTPVIRTNPTPAMEQASRQAAATGAVQAPKSNGQFAYREAVALNKPSVRSVAQAIANKYGLRLMWAAPEMALKGPVTLLANSAEEDVYLLQKAMGVFSPVVLELEGPAKRLWVVPRDKAGTRPEIPDVVSAPAATAAPVASEPVSAATVAAAAPVAAPAVPPVLRLELTEKATLEDSLARLARDIGYTLEWKVSGGFEANRSMSFEAPNLAGLLAQVLPSLGVSADIYTRDKHIVIRPADAARDR